MLNNTERTAWLVGLVGALVLGMPAVGSGQGTVADDRAALEALYDATNGANWSRNDNWKTDEPLGQWFGVRTNSDGRVTRLELVDNRLSGTIPGEIGNLTSLSELFLGFGQLSVFLGFSQLSGTIPGEIGNLTNLTALFLGGNQLSGTIPVEIGNLTSLIALFLGGNQLSGTIPVEIGNLTSLRSLTLGGNQLSGTIPVEIGNLTSLSELYLNDNQLSGTIPVEIGNLTSLSRLRIDTTTGLCLAPDFDLASPFATQSGLSVCAALTPKAREGVQAAVNDAIAAATDGEGLRTGGSSVTVPLDALFTFPSSVAAAVTYAGGRSGGVAGAVAGCRRAPSRDEVITAGSEVWRELDLGRGGAGRGHPSASSAIRNHTLVAVVSAPNHRGSRSVPGWVRAGSGSSARRASPRADSSASRAAIFFGVDGWCPAATAGWRSYWGRK